jgi:hypothetical protein
MAEGRAWRGGMAVGRAVLGLGEAVWKRLPAGARKALETRFFGAIFQVTRVTNDAYGWRPDEPEQAPGSPTEKKP